MAPPSTAVAPASSHSHREGVSGDPVRCPFCDKELPASILSSAAPAANGTMAAEGGVSTTALMSSEGNADRADTSAAKAVISDDDIRRWSTLAGVQVDTPPKPEPVVPVLKAEVKAVPLLPPPPPGARTPKTATRFGFFSKGKGKQEDTNDDDSDSDGIISGYARLGAPESDDEGDDGYESEKEITFKPRPRDDDKPQTPIEPTTEKQETSGLAPPIALKDAPGAGDAELRTVLREVLGRVQALVSRADGHKWLHMLTAVAITCRAAIVAHDAVDFTQDRAFEPGHGGGEH